ncbi:protein kinase domain containing protein [Nitzschia inconspicua]|uniref:Protein kinase domain containing protein n=1 Tax=Nitzschia inconspicua TaxID=303405 RepID=A0A9K3PB96_9STRA|nr:protein kinase domain containing protein [Nitzschia inconspicua]
MTTRRLHHHQYHQYHRNLFPPNTTTSSTVEAAAAAAAGVSSSSQSPPSSSSVAAVITHHHNHHHHPSLTINSCDNDLSVEDQCCHYDYPPSAGKRKKSRSRVALSWQRLFVKAQRMPLVVQFVVTILAICTIGVVLLELSSMVLDDLAMGDIRRSTNTHSNTRYYRHNNNNNNNRRKTPTKDMTSTITGMTSSVSFFSNSSSVAKKFNQQLWNDRKHFRQRPSIVDKHPRVVHVVEPPQQQEKKNNDNNDNNNNNNNNNSNNITMTYIHSIDPFQFVTTVSINDKPGWPGVSAAFTSSADDLEETFTLRPEFIELRWKQPKEIREADKLEVGDCKALAEWQKSDVPTCNLVHEASAGWQQPYVYVHQDNHQTTKSIPPFIIANVTQLSNTQDDQVSASQQDRSEETDEEESNEEDPTIGSNLPGSESQEQMRYINEGNFRQVWMFRDADTTKRVMKTLNADSRKDFDKRNQDRHRRDALSFSQLTYSPLIVNMYGYCSNTGLFDYADGGDLYDIFDTYPNITPQQLLHIAYNITMSLHHAHNFDDRGRATIAHTDIKPDQFLLQDGYYRLSDFNRVRFLTWNYEKDAQCGFRVGKNGGSYRSPEEYNYELENEKVDVYSMGNVLYFLLTHEDPWKRYKVKHVYQLVKQGQRPKVPDTIYQSNGIYERYMIQAMEQAWTHDFRERPGALQIAKILKEGLDRMAAGQTTILDETVST